MSSNSEIQWTDATWNCLAGCEAVSPGCANCYAATMTRRLEAMGQKDYTGLTTTKHFNGKVRCLPDKLSIPLKWRKPRRVFVNSMSDLFHEDVPDEFIRKVFGVMSSCGQHTFQILTKRAKRMAEWFADDSNSLSACQAEFVADDAVYAGERTPTGRSRVRDLRAINGTCRGIGDGNYWPLPNVWLGVSAEDQPRLRERVRWLVRTPAAVRFISAEPLLGPLNVFGFDGEAMQGYGVEADPAVDWVIVGGESGRGARPCDVAWIRSIVEQCKAAGVPAFCKQLGSLLHARSAIDPIDQFPGDVKFGQGPDALTAWVKLKHPKGGDPAEWPEDLRVRQFPAREASRA